MLSPYHRTWRGIDIDKGINSLSSSFCFFLLCASSVNVFMLLSGYLGVSRSKRYSRIIELYLQTAFWSISIACLFFCIMPSYCVGYRIWHFIPLFTKYYWFFTSYFIVIFAMPSINHCVLTQGEHKNRLIIAIFFVLFCLVPEISTAGYHNFRGHAAFMLNDGFSPLWLGYMYYVGAFIGAYGVKALLPKKNNLCMNVTNPCVILICIMIALTISYFIQVLYTKFLLMFPKFHYIQPATVWCYNSPLNVIIAILLLEFFRRLSIPHWQKTIIFGSRYSFGVFLIHCQYHLYEAMKGRFQWIGDFPMFAIPLVISCAVSIFICCTVMDWGRDNIFKGIIFLRKKLSMFERI